MFNGALLCTIWISPDIWSNEVIVQVVGSGYIQSEGPLIKRIRKFTHQSFHNTTTYNVKFNWSEIKFKM